MASLKSIAQQKLFTAKTKVRLGSLSLGDAVLIALTVVRASCSKLYELASKSLKPVDMPSPEEFKTLFLQGVEHRRGSIYAAFVTSVDPSNVFRPDRFAVAIKRLGALEGIEDTLRGQGYEALAEKIGTHVPWFWSDVISREIGSVKKEVGSPLEKFFGLFREDVTPVDIDELLESSVSGTPSTSFRGFLAQYTPSIGYAPEAKTMFTQVFRHVGQDPVVKLPKSSSFEAIFESFYQHLLVDPTVLRRIFPNSSFGGVKISSSALQRILKNSEVKRILLRTFMLGYTSFPVHALNFSAVIRKKDTYGVNRILQNVAKTGGIALTDSAANALLVGLVGLFVAFQQDSKGQRFSILKLATD